MSAFSLRAEFRNWLSASRLTACCAMFFHETQRETYELPKVGAYVN